MPTLNQLIDEFLSKEPKKELSLPELNGYIEALQDLKSRKQELIEGIVKSLKFTTDDMQQLGDELFDRDFFPDYMTLSNMETIANNILQQKLKELTGK